MTLRDLPPVRALAEERARAYWSAVQSIVPTAAPWEQTPAYGKEVQIGAHLALLCNMSPDSRDALVRLVERFGDASDVDKARHHRDNPGELEAIALAVLA